MQWERQGEAGEEAPLHIMSFLPIIFIFVIFYFLLIRPQQKQAKEHRNLLSNLKEGDKVLTSGGITAGLPASKMIRSRSKSRTK